MKKTLTIIIALITLMLLFNCPSTPPVTPTPAPTETIAATPIPTAPPTPTAAPTPEPTATPQATTAVKAVTDEEIQALRNAIARAEEAMAAEYAKDELNTAKKNLEEALSLRTTDPENARKKLEAGKVAADKAYDLGSVELFSRYSALYDKENNKLLQIAADKFLPFEYFILVDDMTKAKDLFTKQQIPDGIAKANRTIDEMGKLYTKLADRLKWINNLKKDVETNLKAAEKDEAYLYIPEKLDQVNEYYFNGTEAMDNYKIDSAEENYGYARELSQNLVAAAGIRKREIQTETMKKEVLDLLEAASKLNVVTEDGEIINADPIDIQEFLRSIQEELNNNKKPEPQSFLDFTGNGVVVLGEISKDNLLLQAKELIKQGVIAEQNGDLDQAMEYYTQARNYLTLYKSQSVNQLYTVRLIPERRDCLWRIAEYDFVYGDPYLWPLIWRRNRKLIQNPSLIEPGWQLIIPEK